MTLLKTELLRDTLEHIDIKAHDVRPLVRAMGRMAFQARNLHRAATLYDGMLEDTECGVILGEMGGYLSRHGKTRDSVVLAAHEAGVPIFCPAFSDCSAGFGLVHHQWTRAGKPQLSIDSARDFLELTRCRLALKDSGLFMVGGGAAPPCARRAAGARWPPPPSRWCMARPR